MTGQETDLKLEVQLGYSPQCLPLVADLSLSARSHVQRAPEPLKTEAPAGDRVFSHLYVGVHFTFRLCQL